MELLKKYLVPGVILALAVAAAFTMFEGKSAKTLTAHFPRTISVYEGSDVRVLGVPVGTVESVTPSGTEVVVTISYDAEIDVPADAQAVIVSPSIVGDRFIQLTPVYTGGPKLKNGATLHTDRTGMPLELDEIYQSLDDLTVALGPNGANAKGALTDLLESTAANFGGQGAKFHQTILDFSKLTGTLDSNKEELFASVTALEGFIKTLADNDKTVRAFNRSMAEVSKMLEGERGELAASLRNLSVAMRQVSGFVKDNKELLGKNIKGLNRVAKVLVKQRDSLDEVLRVAPVALNNLALTYNPQAGTLDTRANLQELGNQLTADPVTLLCGIVGQAPQGGTAACDAIKELFTGLDLPRNAPFGQGRAPDKESFDPSLGGLVEVAR